MTCTILGIKAFFEEMKKNTAIRVCSSDAVKVVMLAGKQMSLGRALLC